MDQADPPGPGAYYNDRMNTGFHTKLRDEKHQFFGSTVERFNEKLRNEIASQKVGPGTYDVDQ